MRSFLVDPKLKQVRIIEHASNPEVFPFLLDAANVIPLMLTETMHLITSSDALPAENQSFWRIKGLRMLPMVGKALVRTHTVNETESERQVIADEEPSLSLEEFAATVEFPNLRYVETKTFDEGLEETPQGLARKIYLLPVFEDLDKVETVEIDPPRQEGTRDVWTVYDDFQTDDNKSSYTAIQYRMGPDGEIQQVKRLTEDSLSHLYLQMGINEDWTRQEPAPGDPEDVLEHWL